MATDIDDLNLFQRMQLAWKLMRDSRVSPWIKRLGPMAILAYVISPIDLIPDFLLGIGQIDDLGIVAIGVVILLRMMVRFAPAGVVNEHMTNITNNKWNATRASYPDGETIETSGRVRQ